MKTEFKVDEKDYFVTLPSARQEKDGMILFAKSLTKYIKEGILSGDKLEQYYRDEGIWDDFKQKERENLEKFLGEGILKLRKGGIKKTEAKDLAIEMRLQRFQLMVLLLDRSKFESFTAESLAEKDRSAFFVSCCTKNADGSRAFSNLDDYLDRENSDLSRVAATKFASLYNGYDENFEKKLPENEFLIKYGFMDEQMQMIQEDGTVKVAENQLEEFTEFTE